ncbi:MAG TPA: Sec-independent protein translocase protein TatB [Albidovulum sp.]|uniref:Sec-independent protein translocase protein TatB n=1 Tax=Albidovulum sp. TaxID=1872424 RepID=UPI002C95195B|nr:Sec-independent protein translocase protein TatB [Albidovulum sp.]
MFDIGGGELLLIAIVALIVVGPKDLPGMFQTLGRFTAKARAMGREFQRAMDDAARESGVKGAADDLKAMTSKKSLGLDALEKAATKFEKWDPTKNPAMKGPATQALAEKRKAEAAERLANAVEATKPAAAPAAEVPKATARTPGRVRKSSVVSGAPASTAKPATAKSPATDVKAAAPAPEAPKSRATKAAAAKPDAAPKAAAPARTRAKKGDA